LNLKIGERDFDRFELLYDFLRDGPSGLTAGVKKDSAKFAVTFGGFLLVIDLS
jgi:hypothetical protein